MKMESLKLVNREKLFYNKFKYRATIYIDGAFTLWYTRRKEPITTDSIHPQNSRRAQIIQNLPKLNILLNWYPEKKKNKLLTLRISRSSVSFYSNDLDVLRELEQLGFEPDYYDAGINSEMGVKYFIRKPKHKFRMYFVNKRINIDVRQDLLRVFQTHKDIHPSYSLQKWIDPGIIRSFRWHYLSATYSIDFDNESTHSYLSLMFNEFIGKFYKLEKRPEQT